MPRNSIVFSLQQLQHISPLLTCHKTSSLIVLCLSRSIRLIQSSHGPLVVRLPAFVFLVLNSPIGSSFLQTEHGLVFTSNQFLVKLNHLRHPNFQKLPKRVCTVQASCNRAYARSSRIVCLMAFPVHSTDSLADRQSQCTLEVHL